MREGEDNHLRCVRRVCQNFLISGDRRVEADLCDGRSFSAIAAPEVNLAARQNQRAGRFNLFLILGEERHNRASLFKKGR